jgi:DNA-binding IclR family transcriptional regulator
MAIGKSTNEIAAAEVAHTPPPWMVTPTGTGLFIAQSPGGKAILDMLGLPSAERTATAAFIVKAVNAYDAQRAEIEKLRKLLEQARNEGVKYVLSMKTVHAIDAALKETQP